MIACEKDTVETEIDFPYSTDPTKSGQSKKSDISTPTTISTTMKLSSASPSAFHPPSPLPFPASSRSRPQPQRNESQRQRKNDTDQRRGTIEGGKREGLTDLHLSILEQIPDLVVLFFPMIPFLFWGFEHPGWTSLEVGAGGFLPVLEKTYGLSGSKGGDGEM
jgi:hypothetical protein